MALKFLTLESNENIFILFIIYWIMKITAIFRADLIFGSQKRIVLFFWAKI